MTELSVGISLFLSAGTTDNATLIEPLLDAIEARVWSKPLRNFMSNSVPGRKIPRRAGMLRLPERREVLREQLTHPDVHSITLANAPPTRSGNEYATIFIETRKLFEDLFVIVAGRQWLPTLDNGDSWVAAMLHMAEALGAEHGVVTVMSTEAVSTECEFVGITRDGILQHPFPEEFKRMRGEAKRELGKRYVRFPRWGTIYARHHVEALGGVDGIGEAVQPAVVRELGSKAWYFQLTASVATATSAEAVEKQRRFTELAEPLLPPGGSGPG